MNTQNLNSPKPQTESSDSCSKKALEDNHYPEYLNTKQTAGYLQLSTQWLEIGRVKGYGPKFIKLGRLVRYCRASLDEYLKDHEVENTVQGESNEP